MRISKRIVIRVSPQDLGGMGAKLTEVFVFYPQNLKRWLFILWEEKQQ